MPISSAPPACCGACDSALNCSLARLLYSRMRPSRLQTTTLWVSSAISAASRLRSCSMPRLACRTCAATSARSALRWRASWLITAGQRPRLGAARGLDLALRVGREQHAGLFGQPGGRGDPVQIGAAQQRADRTRQHQPGEQQQRAAGLEHRREGRALGRLERRGEQQRHAGRDQREQQPGGERRDQFAPVDLHGIAARKRLTRQCVMGRQQLAHLLGQLAGRDRLGHVGIGTERGALGDVGVTALGGQHHDLHAGQRLVGAHRLAHLEAAHARHHHVQQHQRGPLAPDRVQRRRPVARDADFVPLALHQVFERDDDVRLVVGDQDLVGHRVVSSCCHGSSNPKQAPCPGSDFNHMRPPNCSTIWRLIGKPRPVPCGRLLTAPPWRNFSNTSCC